MAIKSAAVCETHDRRQGFAVVWVCLTAAYDVAASWGEQAFWGIVEAYEIAPTDEHWLRQAVSQLPAEE
jgi:hypothetical protein